MKAIVLRVWEYFHNQVTTTPSGIREEETWLGI
jgi:hypothetical protein